MGLDSLPMRPTASDLSRCWISGQNPDREYSPASRITPNSFGNLAATSLQSYSRRFRATFRIANSSPQVRRTSTILPNVVLTGDLKIGRANDVHYCSTPPLIPSHSENWFSRPIYRAHDLGNVSTREIGRLNACSANLRLG